MFAFKADQIQRSENDTMLFVYPPSWTGNHIISTALYLNSSERFPTDFFIARRNEVTTNIFEVNSGSNFSNKIKISNQSADCCATVWRTSIPVFLLPGKFLQYWQVSSTPEIQDRALRSSFTLFLFFSFYFVIFVFLITEVT